ncbi:uncharacterized protein LOC143885940 [Tasmannia lanceolata]|uniref:uncharacterized protein LOC143885940 n=1 Tax=Tasmannia lanceolata TaxID=3420 RepID=UPI00406491A3
MWLEDLSLYPVVENAWKKEVDGTPLYRVTQKLKEVKACIRIWNQNVFGRIDIQAPMMRQKLASIQSLIAASPMDLSLRNAEHLLKDEYVKTANKEEQFYRQKSRNSWLNLRDSNTSYFHSAVKARFNKLSIQGSTYPDGSTTTNPDEVARLMTAFFDNLLNNQNCSRITDPDQIPNPLRVLSQDEASSLTRECSPEEIWQTIKKADGNKAPGPDGFNGDFFKAFWYLVGNDVTSAIQSFFHKDKILPQLNTTFICLIPKCPEASTPEHYRPVALCNFFYKTITKIMANRLKPLMNSLISPFQSAFISGRSIQDNILIAHDLCHNFHRKNPIKAMCIKMDLKKAFDSVNHSSLLLFMEKMGFPSKWCKWVHQCISTASFSVILNGSPHGFFKSTNGLRQGDPLSPLLFCFVMDMLSSLIQSHLAQGSISSPFSKGDLSISHTFFADDVMIYANPNPSSATGILKCLESFKLCSGLEFNPTKSEVFFAGVQNSVRRAICNILHIEEGTLPIKYLGLPLITSRLNSHDCQPIIDKIKKRISSWTNRNLSRVGRVELVKTVLSSFQVYWSTAFHLPSAVLLSIEKVFRDFIWSGQNLERKHHPISWDSICKPISEGGLGIRRLKDLNIAAQIKRLWKIVSDQNSPWVTWFHRKYLRNRSFWFSPMPSNPSWAVRSIFKAREVAKKHICYIVGPDSSLLFWKDPWHPKGPLESQSSLGSFSIFIPPLASIRGSIQDGGWDEILELPLFQELKPILNYGLFSSLSPSCETESVNHLFFSCSFLAWLWRTILKNISDRKKQKNSVGEEELWIRRKFNLKGQSSILARLLFTASIFFIWSERNSRLHNQVKTHKRIILNRIICAARNRAIFLKLDDDHNEDNARIWNLSLFRSAPALKYCVWIPPQANEVKLNTDASLSSDSASIGGILRGSSGDARFMFSIDVDRGPISDLELEAIIQGVHLLDKAANPKLWIESDSLQAVNIIRKEWPCPWKQIPALENLLIVLNRLESWKISHIWREGNRAADYLSKSNCLCKGNPIPRNLLPFDLSMILSEDFSGKSYLRL